MRLELTTVSQFQYAFPGYTIAARSRSLVQRAGVCNRRASRPWPALHRPARAPQGCATVRLASRCAPRDHAISTHHPPRCTTRVVRPRRSWFFARGTRLKISSLRSRKRKDRFAISPRPRVRLCRSSSTSPTEARPARSPHRAISAPSLQSTSAPLHSRPDLAMK
jgi:hypothetical protein